MSTTDQDPTADGGAPAAGLVVAAGRAPLSDTLLHGEPLATHATRALAEAKVRTLARDTDWAAVQDLGLPVVLHDPLCPLTPPAFVAKAAAAAASSGGPIVVVGCRPVTDTIKTVAADRVGQTVDRESLAAVTSPVVLSAEAVAALDGWPDLADFAALVTSLRSRFPVQLLEAPSLGRRVEDESAVVLLEAFEELHPAQPQP